MVGTTPQAASAVFFISAISRLDSSWERLDDKLDELINCLEEITEDGEDPADGGSAETGGEEFELFSEESDADFQSGVFINSLDQLEEEDIPDLYEIKFQPIRLAAGPDAGIRDITEAETLYLHNEAQLHRADGVYKVNGDSMEPTYHDGDMVLVEHIPDGSALRLGEIGAFASGNESYVKEYQADGLHSHN